MEAVSLTGIDYRQIPLVWDIVYPLIETAMVHSHGRSNATAVMHRCMTSKMQLWIVGSDKPRQPRGVFVTEILEYPLATVCCIVVTAGKNMADWIEAVHVIEDWARARDCTMIEAVGRPGWRKHMATLGWKSGATVWEKGL